MKRYIYGLLLLFAAQWTVAQNMNDELGGQYSLGVISETFESPVFSNKYATYSNFDTINFEKCIPNDCMIRDLWFNFSIQNDAQYNISVVPLDNPISNRMQFPAIILYNAPAVGKLALLACNTGERQKATCEGLSLISGNYVLRVSDISKYGEDNSGAFKIIIERIATYQFTDNAQTITENLGILYDNGGLNKNYNNTQNQNITICLHSKNDNIELTTVWYHINETGDNLKIFDGISLTAPLLNSMGVSQIKNASSGRNIVNTASSNCVTLQFNVDGKEKKEGFKITWKKATVKPLGNTFYKINPSDRELDYFFFYQIATENRKCSNRNIALFQTTSDSGFPIARGIVLSANPIENLLNNTNIKIKNEDFIIEKSIQDSTISTTSLLQNTCSIDFSQYNMNPETKIEYVIGSDQFYWPNTKTESDVVAQMLLLENNLNFGIAGLKNKLPNTQIQAQISNINGKHWPYVEDNSYNNIKLKNFTVDSIGTHSVLNYTKKKYKVCDFRMNYTLGIGTRSINNPNSALFFSILSDGHPKVELKSKTPNYIFENSCTTEKDSIVITLAKVYNTIIKYQWRFINPFTMADPLNNLTFNAPIDIVFLPGQTRLAYAISAIKDNIIEKEEVVYFDLMVNTLCLIGVQRQIKFTIRDNATLDVSDIFGTKDTIRTCHGSKLPIKLVAYGGDIYNWSPKSLFSNPSDKEQVLVSDKSQWVYITSQSGTCNLKDSIYIQLVHPTIKFAIDKKIICKGNNIQLSMPNESGFYWSMNGSKYQKAEGIATIKPTASSTIRFKAFDKECASADSVKIEVEDGIFQRITNDTTICLGQSVSLNRIETSTNKYEWKPIDNIDLPKSINPITKPNESISYVAIITSPKGVCQYKDTVNIKVINPKLSLSVLPDTLVVKNTPIKITVNTNSDGKYLWKPTLSTTAVLEDFAKYDKQLYKITFNSEGCTINDSILISTISQQLPLVFTPNNDGLNDYFNFTSTLGIVIKELKIYNRWGSLVYNNENPILGWDGNFQNNAQPSDVYLYRIEYVLGNKIYTEQGDITLLR